MKKYNIKQKLSNDKGITLIALVVTIVVMLIIASVSIYNGMESFNNTRLKGFKMNLEIIQKRVDDIAATNESYVDSDGNVVYLKNQGTEYGSLTTEQKTKLKDITGLNDGDATLESFRYFTSEQLDSIFGLSEIEYNVFIHFDSRMVIAEDGIEINGTIHYMLENNVFFSTYDKNKNKPVLKSEENGGPLTATIMKYSTDKYKIKVTPQYTATTEISGYIKYKIVTTRYWEKSDSLEMIITKPGDYNIIYEDIYGNSVTKMMTVKINNEEATVTIN